MINTGMMSSNTDLWETPQDFFDKCAAEFGPFDLDVCATKENAKAPNYFTWREDGLNSPWHGRCWMNPPYGRTISKWMKKAFQESMVARDGDGQPVQIVVCLVPARTDTAWWHDFCMRGEIRFIRGRLKFGGAKNSAPFPSALVIFKPTRQPEPKENR